ncbi:hypothetical protein HPP92_026042 [Vanilla planifolia]|uniref:Uncharacterized protein n=1 Tax=Vanilla planifolia TaxID=51239 RepID=A0A835PGK8_VANPL|nr:hypothetical protein HPP92_026042 [Vanilla planifolia]
MGVALSITALPVLARILAELKLLTTDIGRMAMSAAAVNDVAAWILLALAIALSGSGSPLVSLGFSSQVEDLSSSPPSSFAPCSPGWPATPPKVSLSRRSTSAQRSASSSPPASSRTPSASTPYSAHSWWASWSQRRALRQGPHREGGRPHFWPLPPALLRFQWPQDQRRHHQRRHFLGAACAGHIQRLPGQNRRHNHRLSYHEGPFREAVTLGFLMNTKGLVELIVLNVGKDRKVLNDETFAIMVLMALFTTFITTPIVMGIYKPARQAANYKHRKIERGDTDSELRVLACFHGSRNIPTLINLIESSRGTRRRGVTIYTMHLMELSERSSAIFMVHKARRNGLPFWNSKKDAAGSDLGGDQIVVAFQAYQQLSHVTVRPMTAISDLRTIHEDVVTSAQRKRVALIILPFHKTQQLDGSMESIGHQYQQANQRVLLHAPCSVAILVDRGLGGFAQVSASEVSYSIVVLFFGGSDDREALAYGLRMAEHPGIAVTVLRFVSQPGGPSFVTGDGKVGIPMDADQRTNDENCISRLRERMSANAGVSVKLEEKVVAGKEEIVSVIKEAGRCNLLLVGQRTVVMPLTARLECPELGPMGSYLGESNSTTASVLVIKQHDPLSVSEALVDEVDEDYVVLDTPIAGGSSLRQP